MSVFWQDDQDNNNNDTKAIEISRVFSKNSQAKNVVF